MKKCTECVLCFKIFVTGKIKKNAQTTDHVEINYTLYCVFVLTLHFTSMFPVLHIFSSTERIQ